MPVLAATRLRKGNAASHHGAPRLIADAAATATAAHAPHELPPCGMVILTNPDGQWELSAIESP